MHGSRPAAIPQEDRTLAVLAHLLQIFTGFLGPLIIAVLKRQTPFVLFHSLQVILWQVAYMVVSILVIVVFVVSILAGAAQQSHGQGAPMWLVVAIPGIVVLSIGGWMLTIVLAIVYAMRAADGKWAEYPLVGRWARRLANG